ERLVDLPGDLLQCRVRHHAFGVSAARARERHRLRQRDLEARRASFEHRAAVASGPHRKVAVQLTGSLLQRGEPWQESHDLEGGVSRRWWCSSTHEGMLETPGTQEAAPGGRLR